MDEPLSHPLKGDNSPAAASRADGRTNLINALGHTLENGIRLSTHVLFYKRK